MPVFLQFRLWLSRGPARERVLAGSAAAVALVLLVLASLPLTDDDGTGDAAVATAEAGGAAVTPVSGAASPGAATGAGTATTVAAGGAPAPVLGGGGTSTAGAATGGAAAPAAAGGAAPAATSACSALVASAPGVTRDQVLVAVSLVNLAGAVGNTAFSIRPDLHEIVAAVVDEINKTGGVACGRKLVAKTYDVNPIDQNDQQAKCLQMVQAKPFTVIDQAGYITPVARSCFVQNKQPFMVSTSAATSEVKQGYPYLYGLTAPSEKQVRDGALGLGELGFFAAPKFQKLGLLEDSCEPAVNAELEANLAKVGVRSGQISKFTLNCNLIAPPSEILQGVLQQKAAGATHVFLASSISNSQRYTQLAAQQNFHPVYGTSDYGTNTASVGDWDPSFVGGLAISSQHSGDLNSGIHSAETAACDRILKAHGRKGMTTEKDDGAAGGVCDVLAFFRQAIAKAGANPTRASFIESGVAHAGTFRAGTASDGQFDRGGKVIGGDFHRALQFDGGCRCWKIRGNPAFRPGF